VKIRIKLFKTVFYRILPGIGQQALAGLSIEQGEVELLNINPEISGRISGDLGLERKEGFLFSAPGTIILS